MAARSSTGAGPRDASACRPDAAPVALLRLRRRVDFQRLSRARRVTTPAFILQSARSGDPDGPPRVGFTVTKKIGNAVTRNRARRRLKEAARLTLPLYAQRGTDYVLVGRAAALLRPFPALVADLAAALSALHNPAGSPRTE